MPKEKANNNAEFLYYFIAALLQEIPYEAGEKLLDIVENYLDTTDELCDALREIEKAADEQIRDRLLDELIKRLTEYKCK